MAPRVLLIGWDGADRELVESLLDAGELPVLASLRARGAAGPVAGLTGLGDDAAWATFATGLGPGVHGRFHHQQPVPGTHREAHFTRDMMDAPPFWDAIARAGHAVVVVDVPKAPVGTSPGLVAIADWMPHGADTDTVVLHPPGEALPARFMPGPNFDCHRVYESQHELDCHLARVAARFELRRQLLNDWVRAKPWDLFIGVVAETHCAGHHAWDPSTHGGPGLSHGPVAQAYRAADEALGELIAAAGEDVTVVVFSLIGMGANDGAAPLLDAILRRLEPRSRPRARSRIGVLAGRVPVRIRRAIARRIGVLDGSVATLRASGRTARALPYDALGGPIRLNVRGREPDGVIEPGLPFEAACEHLATQLLAIRDVDSGRPIVTDVVRLADAFPGPRASAFADLLAIWDTTLRVRRVSSPAIRELEMPAAPARNGNHRSGGWYVAAGPGCPALDGSPLATADFAPVLQSAFNVAAAGGNAVAGPVTP